MDINNLTLGQMKEVAALVGCAGKTPSSPASAPASEHPFVGKYVIARCYSAGVHAGTVASVDGDTAILTQSTRLWSWKAADGVALSGVAQHGIQRDKGKLDSVNPLIYLTGVCELIPCSDKAKGSIHG